MLINYYKCAADGRKLRVTYKIDPTATIEPGEPFLPYGSISPLGQQIMANGLDRGVIQHPIDDPIAMYVIMTRDYCGAYTYRNGSIERRAAARREHPRHHLHRRHPQERENG